MMQFSETVHVFFMVLVICLVCGKQLASALTINDFYPFGPLYGDSQLDDGVDVLSSQVTFPAPFSFFGESFPEVVVSKLMSVGICIESISACIHCHTAISTRIFITVICIQLVLTLTHFKIKSNVMIIIHYLIKGILFTSYTAGCITVHLFMQQAKNKGATSII